MCALCVGQGIICKTILARLAGLPQHSSSEERRSRADVLYCDYEDDSDAARFDVLVLTASASLQDFNKDIVSLFWPLH